MLQYNEYVCCDEIFDLGAAERYVEEFIFNTKKEAHEWIQSLIESIHAPVSVNGILLYTFSHRVFMVCESIRIK